MVTEGVNDFKVIGIIVPVQSHKQEFLGLNINILPTEIMQRICILPSDCAKSNYESD
jgi:hypothetical protein